VGETAFVKGWSSPPPATARKEGDLVFWKGTEDVPSFMSRFGKGEEGDFLGWE